MRCARRMPQRVSVIRTPSACAGVAHTHARTHARMQRRLSTCTVCCEGPTPLERRARTPRAKPYLPWGSFSRLVGLRVGWGADAVGHVCRVVCGTACRGRVPCRGLPLQQVRSVGLGCRPQGSDRWCTADRTRCVVRPPCAACYTPAPATQSCACRWPSHARALQVVRVQLDVLPRLVHRERLPLKRLEDLPTAAARSTCIGAGRAFQTRYHCVCP
jgi:hypothetical protein